MTYGDTDPYSSGATNAIRAFQDMFRYIRANIVGMVYGTAMNVGDAQKQPDLMERAYKMFNADLAEAYRRPDPLFEDGQEFIVRHLGERPSDFCDWAWNDIHKVLMSLTTNGDFSPWMKDGNMMIACYTDGVKPVVFKLERIDETR